MSVCRQRLAGCALALALGSKGEGDALGLVQPHFEELVVDSASTAGRHRRGDPGPILSPGQHEVWVDTHPVRRQAKHSERRPTRLLSCHLVSRHHGEQGEGGGATSYMRQPGASSFTRLGADRAGMPAPPPCHAGRNGVAGMLARRSAHIGCVVGTPAPP